MHEMALARALIELASDRARLAGALRVTRLHCRIGELRQIEPELMHDAFEAAREGTLCSAAALDIEKSPLRARCPRCDRTFAVESWHWNCPECETEGEPLAGGDELELVSIDVEGAA